MCMYQAEEPKQATCIATDKANSKATKTYHFTKAKWDAFLTSMGSLTNSAKTNFITLLDAQSTATAEDTKNFSGFQKWHCEKYEKGVTLECRAWIRKEDDKTNGIPTWTDKMTVKFLQMDGSQTENTKKYYPQNYKEQTAVTLKFTGSISIVALSASTLSAFIMTQLF